MDWMYTAWEAARAKLSDLLVARAIAKREALDRLYRLDSLYPEPECSCCPPEAWDGDL